MQAVCTCFLFSLHEIPLAPNSRNVSRMLSNLDTVPNVRSGLYKPVRKIHHLFLTRRQWFLCDWNARWNYVSWIFSFLKNQETIRKDTKCIEKFHVYSIDFQIEAFNLHHEPTLLYEIVRFPFFFNFAQERKYAPIEIWSNQLGVSLPFIDIIADKWQMQTSLTVTITGQPLSSNNMARQQIEFPISSIGKVLPFHHTRSQLSP